MSSVCVGALPAQCFMYRCSSPRDAIEWISGIILSSLLNFSWKTQINRIQLVSTLLEDQTHKDHQDIMYLPTLRSNTSTCSREGRPARSRNPRGSFCGSTHHGHLQMNGMIVKIPRTCWFKSELNRRPNWDDDYLIASYLDWATARTSCKCNRRRRTWAPSTCSAAH